MDLYRAFLAIGISFLILIGYQYFFVAPVAEQQQAVQQAEQQQTESAAQQAAAPAAPAAPGVPAATPSSQTGSVSPSVKDNPNARDIKVTTPLYTLTVDEQGGGFKSFVLDGYRKRLAEDSGAMELIHGKSPLDVPVLFSLDNGASNTLIFFQAEQSELNLTPESGDKELVLRGSLGDGLQVVRTLSFTPGSYLVADRYQITNKSDQPLQVEPAMRMANLPFGGDEAGNSMTSRYMFSGPVALVNDELSEIKGKALSKGVQILQGNVGWSAYEDSYFMTAVIPGSAGNRALTISSSGDMVRSILSDSAIQVAPGESKEVSYTLYMGPKKLSILQSVGHELARAINFGWFDVLAKPMLWLLNFFNSYIHNYGVAIILLTIVIKLAFWPITQKGMKSMKNMQKLQPKVAKLKEKYKDDPAKMNQEMMSLYKTYKVNPVGGCLPLLLQIPFFFALYKVLLMSIELRHAPFMLWINDLSAPDRLPIGIDIPWLHGIPVLTLLMGASMYLQQKMTPTTADPTQARIMQMLPIVFTFMFVNFASGLVLYWFVNNLLSILQQQMINRQTKPTTA